MYIVVDARLISPPQYDKTLQNVDT